MIDKNKQYDALVPCEGCETWLNEEEIDEFGYCEDCAEEQRGLDAAADEYINALKEGDWLH